MIFVVNTSQVRFLFAFFYIVLTSSVFNFLFPILNVFCSLNLDNYLLLQPFCTKAQFLHGKAKQDITEKLAGKVKFCSACLLVFLPS